MPATGIAERRRVLWPRSGYRDAVVLADGQLGVTDALLRAFIDCPELRPVEESCATERRLFAQLLDDPRGPVHAAVTDAIVDPDARENWQLALGFRDLLLDRPSLEASYWSIVTGELTAPPPFLQRLTRILVHHLLAEESDPLLLRAGELLFRTQAVSADGETVRLADLQTLHRLGGPQALRRLRALIDEARGTDPTAAVPELDAIDDLATYDYLLRSEEYDTVLDIGLGSPGSRALCELLRRWVRHFHGVDVQVDPVSGFEGTWRWHLGLDAQASLLLDRLYRNGRLEPGEQWRLIALYTLRFEDPADAAAVLQGRPVYLALAMTEDEKLTVKPQNLLVNLPLAPAQ